MAWIFTLLGLAMAAAGGGALYVGWPLVPLERGWTLTIAGSVAVSGGVLCLALVGVMAETRRLRRSLERMLGSSGAAAVPEETVAAPRIQAAPPLGGKAAREDAAGIEERSVTIGDTTFIVFDDGSIESRTQDGVRRFGSMQELRDHLAAERDA